MIFLNAVAKFILILFFLTVIGSPVLAQQCEQNLSLAQERFEKGHLNGIPVLLSECLRNGFSRSEKIQAYRLLTISYLYNDDPFGAENSFLKLLELDPEYRVTENDPVELELLSNQYIADPIISWRLSAGANATFGGVNILHVNGTDNTADTKEKYSSGYGFQVNGSADIHFSNFISLMIGVEFGSSQFGYTNELFEGTFLNAEGAVEPVVDLLSKKENNLYLSIPLAVKFTYPIYKWHPYAYIGFSPDFSFNHRADLTLTPGSTGSVTQSPVTGPKLDISSIRKDVTYSMLYGLGVMRRIGYKYVFVDLRYKGGFKNNLVEKNQLDFEASEDINDYTFKYGMVDDDLRLNAFSISAGVVIPMYKPRRKNTVTLQTTVKSWFKRKEKQDE